jgi:hypothetical protein
MFFAPAFANVGACCLFAHCIEFGCPHKRLRVLIFHRNRGLNSNPMGLFHENIEILKIITEPLITYIFLKRKYHITMNVE